MDGSPSAFAFEPSSVYETATATCQMVPLSEGLWHPLFICDPSWSYAKFTVTVNCHSVTKTSLVFFDQQFGSLLNTQIESLAANRYGDGDVNAATVSRCVTQVPHACCRLFSSLQLQVCLRLSGSIVPRWSHLISVFRLYCDHCLIMPLAPQVNRTEDPIAAPGYDLRARCSSW